MTYRAVNILIGNACDMHCPYCLQTGTHVPANRPADIAAFIDGLAAHLNGQFPRRFIFWGGEPMLYWAKIREVMDGFELKGVVPTEGFFITTNGRKMTDAYVEYANSKKVWTTVSTHGWEFDNEQLDRIFRLKHFSLSVIIQHDYTTFWDLRQYFYSLRDRYGIAPRICLHLLRANDGCAPECWMTRDDVDKLCDHLLNEVVPLACAGDLWAQWQCSQLLFARNKELTKGSGGKCVRADRLSVDLHGNIYECHHNFDASNIIGNLFKKSIPIVADDSRERLAPNRFLNSDDCRKCSIFNECRGGCYLSNTHDVDCYLAREMHSVYETMDRIFSAVPCVRNF